MAIRTQDVIPSGHPSQSEASLSFGHGFAPFHRSTKFSDVVVIDAAHNKIPTHRLVLSAGSRKFNQLLSDDDLKEIHCTDVEPECLDTMLEYLYIKRCNIQVANAVQLLATAQLYGCDELENMASLYIHMQLTANTCCFFFAEAQKYNVEHIAIKALYVVALHFQNVIRSQGFFDLSLENLIAMLGSPKLASIRKDALYRAACAWIINDGSRLEKLKDVLLCIHARSTTTSDDLHILNLLNRADGPNVDEVEWTTLHGSTSATRIPFLSRRSGELRVQNDNGLALNEAQSGVPFLKESKTDDGEVSTEASRFTSTFNMALLELRPKTDRHMEVNSAKSRQPEDNASSEISSTRKPKPKRGRSRKENKAGQRFACQVEGCTNSLQGLKEYHIRYKICHHHLKVNSIVKDGQHQRFCQQCGRFHLLQEFDNNKRSCRTRLERHNLRRRKRMHPKGTKPASILQPLPYQQLVCLHRDNESRSIDMEKLVAEGRSRCLPILPPHEMNPCVMLSSIPPNLDRDPTRSDRPMHEAEHSSVRPFTISAKNVVPGFPFAFLR